VQLPLHVQSLMKVLDLLETLQSSSEIRFELLVVRRVEGEDLLEMQFALNVVGADMLLMPSLSDSDFTLDTLY
jgi:hypothetical protein